MFTGLVQAVGEVRSIDAPSPGGITRLGILPSGWAHVPALGDSICVSGCCLTVAGIDLDTGAWQFDAVPETLARTKLGTLKVGDKVNLERALLPTTLMGGHLVQGHVDGIGEVVKVQRGDDWRIRIRPADAALLRYMIPKGGVAIDGVSLTIASVGVPPRKARPADRAAKAATDPGFEIALIPTTLAKTTLGDLMPGAMVNIEADITAKTIVHYIEHFGMPEVMAPRPIRSTRPARGEGPAGGFGPPPRPRRSPGDRPSGFGPRSGPPRSGPPRSGPPRSGPPRSGPSGGPRRGPGPRDR